MAKLRAAMHRACSQLEADDAQHAHQAVSVDENEWQWGSRSRALHTHAILGTTCRQSIPTATQRASTFIVVCSLVHSHSPLPLCIIVGALAAVADRGAPAQVFCQRDRIVFLSLFFFPPPLFSWKRRGWSEPGCFLVLERRRTRITPNPDVALLLPGALSMRSRSSFLPRCHCSQESS